MKERIKELRKVLKLSQKEFSKRINVGYSTLAMFETGQRNIKDIHIKSICLEFGVNENWLRTGEGEMFNEIDTLDELLKKSDATELEIEIIKAYLNLDKNLRRKLISDFKKTFNRQYQTKDKPRIVRVPARGGHYDINETEEQRKALETDINAVHEYDPKDF